jgi:hypothetical protein
MRLLSKNTPGADLQLIIPLVRRHLVLKKEGENRRYLNYLKQALGLGKASNL